MLMEDLWIHAQVKAGILFVALSQFFRVKSFWNKNKVMYELQDNKLVMADVWSQKETKDFLHHLKFEFLQFNYFVCCMLLAFEVFPWGKLFFERMFLRFVDKYFIIGVAPVGDRKAIVVLFLAIHIMQFLVMLLLVNPWNRREAKRYQKKVVLICLQLLLVCIFISFVVVVAMIFVCHPEYIFFWKYKEVDDTFVSDQGRLVVQWIQVEIFMIPFFVMYYIMIASTYLSKKDARAIQRAMVSRMSRAEKQMESDDKSKNLIILKR